MNLKCEGYRMKSYGTCYVNSRILLTQLQHRVGKHTTESMLPLDGSKVTLSEIKIGNMANTKRFMS